MFISAFSFPLATTFHFGNHRVLRYVVKLFLFGKEVHLYPSLDSTSKRYHMILVFPGLTYLT